MKRRRHISFFFFEKIKAKNERRSGKKPQNTEINIRPEGKFGAILNLFFFTCNQIELALKRSRHKEFLQE